MSRLDRVIFDPDTTPPSVPTLSAPTVVSSSRLDVSWSASTDTGGSGLAGYNLLKDGSTLITLGVQTSYSDTGLATGSTHTYRVQSRDHNTNTSAFSSQVQATTQGVGLAWQTTIPTQQLSVGVPFSLDLDTLCSGAVGYQTVTGSLPAGLTLNDTTGVISGTPTTAQTVSPTFRAFDSTAASDWQARIAGTGVVWYHNFDAQAEADNFRFVGGTGIVKTAPTSDCRWLSSDGFAGGGCLEINIPTGGTSSGQWFRPFSPLTAGANSNGRGTADPGANGTISAKTWNALDVNQYAWTQGLYGHSDYSSGASWDGNDFYIQFRMKFSANRANTSNPPGKLVYIDVPNGGDQEIIIKSWSDANVRFDMYTNFGSRNNSYLYQPQDDGAGPWSSLQPGSEYASPPTYWTWPMNEWVTVLMHITPGRRANAQGSDNVTYGGSPATNNTGIEVWVARAGATAYTKIWSKLDYVWAYDTLANGFNMFKASGYMNGVNAVAGWTQRYTQIIFSKNTIPCPQV